MPAQFSQPIAETPTPMYGLARYSFLLLVALGVLSLAGAHCPNRCRSVERSWTVFRPSFQRPSVFCLPWG